MPGSSSTLLKNKEQYDSSYADGSQNGTVGKISKYAGALNSIKVSVCASSNAYFDNAVDAVNMGSGASVDATAIVVDDDAKFLVRDIIKFSTHATKYRITAINTGTNTLTIESIDTPVAK